MQSQGGLATNSRRGQKSCPNWSSQSKIGRARPKLAEVGQNLVIIGRKRLKLAEVGPKLIKIGRYRYHMAELAHKWPKPSQSYRSRQIMAEIARVWPKSHQDGRSRLQLADIARIGRACGPMVYQSRVAPQVPRTNYDRPDQNFNRRHTEAQECKCDRVVYRHPSEAATENTPLTIAPWSSPLWSGVTSGSLVSVIGQGRINAKLESN